MLSSLSLIMATGLDAKSLHIFYYFFSQNKNLNLIKLTHSKHFHSKIIKKLTKSKNLFSNSKLCLLFQ